MSKKLDLTGETFGRLTVIKEVEPHIQPSGKKVIKWLCECSCGSGKEVRVTTTHLRSGHTQSCGCLNKERIKEAKTKHGMSASPEYATWRSIKRRCYNENHASYENYGGRGIKVCNRWLESFENFYKDMGDRPSNNHSIERLDVNGDYCPDNCIWIENEKQARNQRKKKNNTSGVNGIHFNTQGYWKATWYDLEVGKQKAKSFPIKKYGNDEAFRLACEYRQKMVDELNEQGAGYGSSHGG